MHVNDALYMATAMDELYDNEENIAACTDHVFSNMGYQQGHQTGISPLLECGVACVSGFVLDYMHLVCLGVMKRILHFFKNGPRCCCKLGSHQLSLTSDDLTSFKGLFPSEFVRQPKGLDEMERWKATELHRFLLYTGPLVLKNILSKTAYTLFPFIVSSNFIVA